MPMRTSVSRVFWAALLGCVAAFGCNGDGPTGPEQASVSELFGDQLFKADGTPVGVGVLENTSVIGIYFATPTCPACGAFTPLLVDAFNQLREDGRSFEVVLVSPGISDPSLFDYMVDSEMPWLAVSSEGIQANFLLDRFDIRWVPTLLLIDSDGETISKTGREDVTQDGPDAYDAWLAAGGSG